MTEATATVSFNKTKTAHCLKVDPRLIETDKDFNVRDDYGDIESLMKSIDMYGVKVPLQGYRKGNKYIVTDGFRRMEAVNRLLKQKNDIKYVPFIMETHNRNEEDRIVDMFTCNSGKPLTELEECKGFQKLLNKGWTQLEIAEKVNVSPVHVSTRLKLGGMGTFLKNLLIKEVINVSMAMNLLEEYPDEKDQRKVAEKMIAKMKRKGKEKLSGIKIPGKKKTEGKYHKMFSQAIDIMKEDSDNYSEVKVKKVQGIMKALNARTPETLIKILMEVI